MKKMFIIILGFAGIFIGCNKERVTGSGAILTEQRGLNGFNTIYISGSTNVYVTKGLNYKVEVKGYENLLPYFEAEIDNNTLQLGYKNNVNVKNDNVEVFVTLPELKGLSLSGSGNITTTGNFEGNSSFQTNISGSGNIKFSEGTTKNYTSSITGSGNIKAFGLAAEHADISISGSGNNEVNATGKLKVKISGSGNVYYKNTPAITTTISGSGAVIPK
ncbi:MAG: DUF2807 domain-containing protein [Chitinophagaceae bacterium]|jgi:hypothetical protein|nr:DUF2807 domain-containing protein [Chitinophagaceae bacterium]